MESRWKNLPVQVKIAITYIIANLFVLLVNLLLLMSIHLMTFRMDQVYQKNVDLNVLSEALDSVQDSMTTYLSVKSSDALEDYYRAEQTFHSLVNELGTEITDTSFDRMERNIRAMSEEYIEIAEQTIEAKRGRNVEKYRVRYENASALYDYLSIYIDGMNTAQFKHNSETYNDLLQTFRFFERFCTIVMFIMVIANVISINYMTRNIMRPLRALSEQANEVAKGNLDVEELPIEARDEIGVVTIAFNQMVTNLRKYIERLKESMEMERALKEKELRMETHLKDARLKYLQAQINPHFLFNSLNAGAQLAMMEDADRTYQYVQNMADFFRYNVKSGTDSVTLRDELELVDNYVYIINVRFAGEIHYEKEIDETILYTQMPSMILQPLVENCINHGIREMEGKGIIILSVFKEGDRVVISIKDNGKGMSADTITKVLAGTYRDSVGKDSNGIGMDNVIARMRLFTGKRDVVKIVSEGEGEGTEVLLYLPADV